MAHQQSQVQADAEPWDFPSRVYGFVAARFVDHQTRGGQNAVAMGADDGLIHGMRQPEIVGVDDEAARRLFSAFTPSHNWAKSNRWRGPQPRTENQHELARLAQFQRARAKDVKFSAFQFLQQPPIDRPHQFGGDHCLAVFGGQGFLRELVKVFRPRRRRWRKAK